MKHFESAQGRINWNSFTPNDIYFKSNLLTKGMDDEINIISYKNKGDFYGKHDFGVFVKLNNTREAFPHAEINIYDRRPIRTQNQNSRFYYRRHFDNLVYLYSTHQAKEWKRDANGDWVSVEVGDPKPNLEGYAIEFHNFSAENERSCQEQIDIVMEVRYFLATRILGNKQKKELTMVA